MTGHQISNKKNNTTWNYLRNESIIGFYDIWKILYDTFLILFFCVFVD